MNIQDIEQASLRLKTVLRETPLGYSRTFSEMSGNEIYLKYENLQKTGSFKIRGAYNKIAELANNGKTKNIVACSAGNHAQGVAFAASQLDMNAVIVMPKTTPIAKIKATQDYGAKVILHGACYDDAYKKALEIQKELKAELIHPFDDTCVIAGQGTLGQEILASLPNVEVVFVPAGGGGLLAGVAFYLKNINPNIKVIGVQAEGAPAIKRSFDEKKQITLTSVSTIADGIAVKCPGKITQKIGLDA